MHRPILVALTALVATALASPAHAQLSFRGVEFWGGQYAWAGDQTDPLDAGFRGGFAAWGELSPALGVGLELVTGGFDSNPDDPDTRLRWDDTGVNAIGRLALGSRAGLHPFLEARFGWTRISTVVPGDIEGQVRVLREDGLSYGGEIGVELPLNRRARIVAAGGATFRNYGDARLEGTTIPGTSFSGTRWGFRLGVALGRAVD